MDRVDNKDVKPKGTPWTKELVNDFIRQTRPWINAAGFDVGLTGSMLDKEEATDLDIIIYPMNASNFNRGPLQDFFDRMAPIHMSPGRVMRAWESLHSNDSKHVEKRKMPDGKLIDIFWLT